MNSWLLGKVFVVKNSSKKFCSISSCSTMIMVISMSMCFLMISLPLSEARIDSKNKEMDPSLLEEKFRSPSSLSSSSLSADISSGSGDVQPASDALQHFLKELDRYVAIAGRPRFGRSAYKPRPLLSEYLLSRNLNEFPMIRYLDHTD